MPPVYQPTPLLYQPTLLVQPTLLLSQPTLPVKHTSLEEVEFLPTRTELPKLEVTSLEVVESDFDSL